MASANEAASTDPAETLRGTTIETPKRHLTLWPFLLLAAAGAISSYFALSADLPVLSFAACFFTVTAFAALIPTITSQLTPLLGKLSALLPWELACAL